jgi:YidC/Oxa1 family membrane protein insertase
MDQKRMILAIAISIAILLGYQMLVRPYLPQPAVTTASIAPPTATAPKPSNTVGVTPSDAGAAPVAPPKNVPRLPIEAPRVSGSISLVGARFDDLVLRDYRETTDPKSPLVRLLEPQADPQPYFVQFGWTALPGTTVKLPDSTTLWTAEGGPLSNSHPVILTWNNDAGLIFRIEVSVDDNYMFSIRQSVRNDRGAPVTLYPWSRLSRDYTPETSGYYILHEGLIGVLHDRLQETTYAKAKSEGAAHDGVAFTSTGDGGWSGITDKYWLVALIPDQAQSATTTFRHIAPNGQDSYQVAVVDDQGQTIAPGAEATAASRMFAGAKVVRMLDRYEDVDKIPSFDKAVDFGWFYFLTKPIFYALDWLNSVFGNFGVAIMLFTLFVKLLFFPLANKSYRSMSRMKLLGPKITAMRERFKDDPARQQTEMMALYKAEKVNPASGCLPMLVQIPVFFSLYKDIFVTIELRQAPFFGWIHDLSAVDPTNIFNLFGLLPFDPTVISPFLHLGVWPLIMGGTMFLQQKLNPAPPDPVQARLFQFMPLIFMFMLARFPAGLVIYWSWNNTLTVAQQWFIQRRTSLPNPRAARV